MFQGDYEVVTPSVTPVTLGERCTTPYFNNELLGLEFGFLQAHAVQGAQVDQNVGEGVLVGNGLAIA